jgi:hypothetical protein
MVQLGEQISVAGGRARRQNEYAHYWMNCRGNSSACGFSCRGK